MGRSRLTVRCLGRGGFTTKPPAPPPSSGRLPVELGAASESPLLLGLSRQTLVSAEPIQHSLPLFGRQLGNRPLDGLADHPETLKVRAGNCIVESQVRHAYGLQDAELGSRPAAFQSLIQLSKLFGSLAQLPVNGIAPERA